MATTIENTNANLILDAVRRDDVKQFSEIVSKEKSCFTLCFGRFPLLSLCYLFKSRKIVRTHGKKLAAVSGYLNADEPADAYQLFKKAAGTNLRLFDAESIVSPAETLAVLQETNYLKQKFNSLNVKGKAAANITLIYASRGQTAKLEGKKLALPHEPMKKNQKIFLSVFAVFACFFIAVYAVGLSLVNTHIGLGTEKSPSKIYSAEHLKTISDKDGYYLLSNDITLPDGFSIDKFSAKLDGGGHTVMAASSAPFADEITGSVSNLNFVLETVKKTTSADFGFVTVKNSGIISSVTLALTASVNIEGESELLNIGLIAAENTGEIVNCSVNGSASFTGLPKTNTIAGAVAGTNSGLINNCQNNAAITADTVDTGGVAGENTKDGKITNCLNAGGIAQTTALANWNPNTAGIAALNYGEITSCQNNADILAETTYDGYLAQDTQRTMALSGGITCSNEGLVDASKNSGSVLATATASHTRSGGIAGINTAEVTGCENEGTVSACVTAPDATLPEALSGGIVAINAGLVQKCKNYGETSVESTSSFLLVAGVVAWNTYANGYYGSIINNGSLGKLSYNADDSANVFLGGIVAWCGGGLVKDNFSAAIFNIDNNQLAWCAGGVAGCVETRIDGIILTTTLQNNYYLSRQNITFGIGAGFRGTVENPYIPGADVGTTQLATEGELKNLSIYF